MPRKLLQDCGRGWYGREDHFSSLMRMSLESMMTTKVKNQQVRFRHGRSLVSLQAEERHFRERTETDIRVLRQDLASIRAYGQAYRECSFYATDPKRREAHALKKPSEESKGRGGHKGEQVVAICASDDVFVPGIPSHEVTSSITDDVRDADAETKTDYPLKETSSRIQSHQILASSSSNETSDGERIHDAITDPGAAAEKQMERISEECSTTCSDRHSVPVGEPPQVAAENGLELTAGPPGTTELRNDLDLPSPLHSSTADPKTVAQPRSETFHVDSVPPPSEQKTPNTLLLFSFNHVTQPNNDTLANGPGGKPSRYRPHVVAREPPRPRVGVCPPECRNTFTLRRFIDNRAAKVLVEMSPEAARRRHTQKLLTRARDATPGVIQRSKTTSAIFRDYHAIQGREVPKVKSSNPHLPEVKHLSTRQVTSLPGVLGLKAPLGHSETRQTPSTNPKRIGFLHVL